jgi:hypothetical protein
LFALLNENVDSRRILDTPAEERTGKTPQLGWIEEACQFVRGKGEDFFLIKINNNSYQSLLFK